MLLKNQNAYAIYRNILIKEGLKWQMLKCNKLAPIPTPYPYFKLNINKNKSK